MAASCLIFPLLLLALISIVSASSPLCTAHDQLILRRLHPDWSRFSDKDNNGCQWPGIACNSKGRVVSLSLSSRNLTGSETLTLLSKLRFLRAVDLSDNLFTGALKSSTFSNWPRLRILKLQRNGFTGQISQVFSSFKKLEELWLDHNLLTGAIPESISELSSLKVLSLSGNLLSGSIPEALANLSNLSLLFLSDNKFNGSLPLEILYMKRLRVLEISISNWKQDYGVKKNILSANCFERHGSTGILEDKLSRDEGQLWQMHRSSSKISFTKSTVEGISSKWTLNLKSLHTHEFTGMENSLKSLPNEGYRPKILDNEEPGNNTRELNCTLKNVHSQELALGRSSIRIRYLQDVGGINRTNGMRHQILIASIIAASCVVLTVTILVTIFVCRRTLMLKHKRNPKLPPRLPSNFRRELSKVFDPSLRSISMRDLISATDNFNYAKVVGDGGFGMVYSANLPDGRTVAVKRLSFGGNQGLREFEAEMETLGKIKHPNLVELLAYCKVGDERLLVYDFMENGSLDAWLYEKPNGPEKLDWITRLRVAQGAARGLSYLHHGCNPQIIHRDIKSSNILLGKNFEPQIADFGLARLMTSMASHVSTDAAGTIGYIAPEYALANYATKKSDVYSFGMVLLELLTRKRPNLLLRDRDFRTTASWCCHMLEMGKAMEILDPVLKKKKPPQDQVLAYLSIACDCVSEMPCERPSMKEVSERLDFIGK